jgi:hypothetical protein
MTSHGSPLPQPSDRELLDSRVRLPQHVVHRSFVAETVVLNLRTGRYHGLNPTAGKMLESLDEMPSVGGAVPVLASEYGIEPERVERDLLTLVRGMLERGLLEITNDGD